MTQQLPSEMAQRILKATQEGVDKALWRHHLLGESIAVWRDGQVVEIAPEDIPAYLKETELDMPSTPTVN